MTVSRAYTQEEVLQRFISQIEVYVSYWANLPSIDVYTGIELTAFDRCKGVAHSVLALIDGVTDSVCAIDLSLQPHPSDKEDAIENGENWFEPDMVINDCMLHDLMIKK